jgi:hypothetical protein
MGNVHTGKKGAGGITAPKCVPRLGHHHFFGNFFQECPTLCVGVKFGVLTCFGTQVNQLTFNNVKITFIDKQTILSANFIC